jgi:hypothetical protein
MLDNGGVNLGKSCYTDHVFYQLVGLDFIIAVPFYMFIPQAHI